jgi:hypothetical protein
MKQQSALYPDLQIIVVMRRVIACCPGNDLHGIGLVLVVDTVSISVYFSWYFVQAIVLRSICCDRTPGLSRRVENVNETLGDGDTELSLSSIGTFSWKNIL